MKLFFISYLLFSILLLLYLLVPGPSSVFDFSSLPQSLTSDEPGDTIQVPNLVAYFSYSFRDFIVPFYIENNKNLTWVPFAPIRLNHPPEYSWEVVLDQVRSTYLEELVYPMRGSLFINGYEPFLEDGTARFQGAAPIHVDQVKYDTKTTLRYYHSPVWARLVLWVGVCSSVYFIWIMGKK